MFKSRKEIHFDNIETVIAAGVVFKGEIKAAGSMRVDGEVEGLIDLKGDLVVGDRGKIKGTLTLQNILIAGSIEGNITSRGRIEITPTGTIVGDVESETFVVEEGGKFQGNCRMRLERNRGERQGSERQNLEKLNLERLNPDKMDAEKRIESKQKSK